MEGRYALPGKILVYKEVDGDDTYLVAYENKDELPDDIEEVGVYVYTETKQVVNNRELK